MVRLYVFAEGATEQTFANIVLSPHLARLGVYLHRSICIAKAKKKCITYRGGGSRYQPMKNGILRLLAQERAKDVYFTTMIDLYAIHANFPGLDESEKLRNQPGKRVEFLERAFGADIGDNRFIPYIQLHEYEAYLFCEPGEFRYFYDRHDRQIAELQAVADSHKTPEEINDGPLSAPSKRIIGHLPDYEDAKAAIGPQIAALIGLEKIRAKCPHFNAWLSRLEKLGSSV